MRGNLVSRLERLEEQMPAQPPIVCLAINPGESREQCARRCGFDPRARRPVLVFLDDADERA